MSTVADIGVEVMTDLETEVVPVSWMFSGLEDQELVDLWEAEKLKGSFHVASRNTHEAGEGESVVDGGETLTAFQLAVECALEHF